MVKRICPELFKAIVTPELISIELNLLCNDLWPMMTTPSIFTFTGFSLPVWLSQFDISLWLANWCGYWSSNIQAHLRLGSWYQAMSEWGLVCVKSQWRQNNSLSAWMTRLRAWYQNRGTAVWMTLLCVVQSEPFPSSSEDIEAEAL